MKKSICVVTSTRAEFGLLLPLLRQLSVLEDIQLRLVVTGTHMIAQYGNTLLEIEACGIEIDQVIDIQIYGNSPREMSLTMAEAMRKFSEYFETRRPDLLVVLGDRYEIAAICASAVNERIPIAHLHGGEQTQGLIDECYRHSITKMSTLHFTACEEYRRRVIQLGEDPNRVFNVGALGVENILQLKPMTLDELEVSLGFKLKERPFAIVTFHPVTLEDNTAGSQVNELIAAMDAFPNMRYIITLANADAGGHAINQIWKNQAETHSNWLVIPSMGAKRYLSALHYATMMLGNSSSGILEAPAMHLPTVNIGDRQKGRMMAQSIINCAAEREQIILAMQKALSEEHKMISQNVKSPFGEGDTSKRISEIICEYLNSEDRTIQKSFFDLSFEVE